ncbi:hypothetical protein F4821DRAFT_280044 [Hypoxylon rubiginosum]|uniref:Uncharacterized protein n=1 Tax=Hypoxylon rubiginosum TaxID=110542 RepID=A0ACC0CVJ5_9PEZI|nr:hypothetical protein F4821DRAFT_280044 [Hypoxylon rubiginosum]
MKLCTLWQLPLKVSAVFYGLAAAQVHLSNVNTTGLSATCIAVLQQSIACDPLLLQVGFGRFETDATLSTVCTSSCATALTTYIRRINGAATTSTPANCEGSEYDIQAGDTCQSISLKTGISSATMLQANGLQAYCANFPTSGSVCIPTSMHCSSYELVVGDTCDTVASKLGLTKPQLVSWNPEVGPVCGNIGKLASKGMTLCVSNPGGDWVDPNPTEHQPTSTVTPWSLVITNSGTAFSAFPSATPIPTLYPNGDYVTPFANGSWLDCDVYMSPPVLLDVNNRTYSYTCADVADGYGITVDDLLLWNPGINTTGGFSDPCELSFAYQYCVVPTASLPDDTTPSCVFPALAEPRWTCGMYLQRYNITQAAFTAWNPSVGTDCLGFRQGATYCASVQHYRPAGEISTCSYWSMANDTNPADNPCGIFESKYKLDHARFVAWNPTLNSDCSGIVQGYDYCVGTPTFHPGFPG